MTRIVDYYRTADAAAILAYTRVMVRFVTKIDRWLGIVILSVPVITIAAAIPTLASGDKATMAIAWGTVLAVFLLYGGIVWPIAYYIDDEQLTIRAGLWRIRVPLSDIVRVSPSRNPLASPALSLDRLRLDRRDGRFALISPADRAGFIHALQERAPHVVIDDRLRSE